MRGRNGLARGKALVVKIKPDIDVTAGPDVYHNIFESGTASYFHALALLVIIGL